MLQVLKSDVGSSVTDGLLLEGAHTWTPTMFIRLVQVVYFHKESKKISIAGKGTCEIPWEMEL